MLDTDWCPAPLFVVRKCSKRIGYLLNGGGASIVRGFFSDPFFSGEVLSTFTHLSLGKAGPVTLENHIHAKALKMQGSPDN